MILASILFYSCKKEKTIPVPDNLVLYDEENKQYYEGMQNIFLTENTTFLQNEAIGKIYNYEDKREGNKFTIFLREYLNNGQTAQSPVYKCTYSLKENERPSYVDFSENLITLGFCEFRPLKQEWEKILRYHYIEKDIKTGIAKSEFTIENTDSVLSKYDCELGTYNRKLYFDSHGYFDISKNSSFPYPEKFNQPILLNALGKIMYLDKRDRVCLYDCKSGTLEQTPYRRKLLYEVCYYADQLYYMSDKYFYYSKDRPIQLPLRVLGSAYGDYYSPREWYRIDRTTGEKVKLDLPVKKFCIIGETKKHAKWKLKGDDLKRICDFRFMSRSWAIINP